MSEPTKQEALAKLASFRLQVGYPDKWQDYSTLKIDRGSFVANVQRVRAFESDKRMAHIGMAPDPNEWTGVPQVFDGLAGRSTQSLSRLLRFSPRSSILTRMTRRITVPSEW